MADPQERDTIDVDVPAPERDVDLEPGVLVAGKFEILDVIGSGSTGTVYAAEHRSVGHRVAVKVLASVLSANSAVRRRFRAEARAAAAIGHPNIVYVLDAGELPDGRPFIVMEHLQGHHLLEELRTHGRLGVDRACRIVRDVARALAAAHDRGIVHRDLKAENVMIVAQPEREMVKVLDFGIAVHISDLSRRLTGVGVVLGTPAYMAPEHAVGSDPQPAFDIYALGVLLFELLTGEPPFHSSNVMQLLEVKANTVAPSLDEKRDGVPAEIVELVRECLAIDPAERPRSASVVADRLTMFLDAPATARHRTSARPSRLQRSWALVGAAIVLAMAASRSFDELDVDAPTRAARGQRSAPSVAEAEAAARTLRDRSPVTSEPVALDGVVSVSVAETLATHADPPSREPRSLLGVSEVARDVAPSSPRGRRKRGDGPVCERMRQAATQAREDHSWNTVLRETERASCWPSRRERAKLRLKALMELGRFADCVSIGRTIAGVTGDPELGKWLRLCERRVEDP